MDIKKEAEMAQYELEVIRDFFKPHYDPMKGRMAINLLDAMGYEFVDNKMWEKKPQKEVVYVPVQFAHKWQCVKAVEDGDNDGEQIYVKVDGDYDHATPSHAIDSFCTLYRKEENDIDWQHELSVFLSKHSDRSAAPNGVKIGGEYLPSKSFIKMCHYIASITQVEA